MTFKKFFYISLIYSISIILTFVSFNIYMDEYGLFGEVKGQMKKIWYNERTSKYLLSYKYIPENFEGILIGSSVSDNLDTKKILGFKVYNASINGGNISELKPIVQNVVEKGNLRFIIICLYPYLTKNHGLKTSYINPQEYWGALGSKEILKMYIAKSLIRLGLVHDKFNDYGYHNFNLDTERKAVAAKIKNKDVEYIDNVAYAELSQLIDSAKKKRIKILGFYYPYYIENFNEKCFKTYKDKIDRLFEDNDFIWDMNTDEYLNFRSNLSNYYDKGHFSLAGAHFIIKDINNKLNPTLLSTM